MCFYKRQAILTIKDVDVSLQCTTPCKSNKAGFHKAAACCNLDWLLGTDWMCRAEWAPQVKCLKWCINEYAFTRSLGTSWFTCCFCLCVFIYLFIYFTFDDCYVIVISYERKVFIYDYTMCFANALVVNRDGYRRKPFFTLKKSTRTIFHKHNSPQS